MKQFLRLESFQKIFFWFFMLGLIFGVQLYLYFAGSKGFNLILLLPIAPLLFFIAKGLYKNGKSFLIDLKSIKEKA
jgi:hypothetical protein